MIPTPITDHVAQGLARFYERFSRNQGMRGWLTSYLERVQELENLLWEIIHERLLDNATGVQLDIWGRILNQPRISDDDEVYRTVLRARALINRSNGTLPNIITLLRLILSELPFRIDEVWPNQIRIWVDHITDVDPDLIARLVGEARAATKQVRVHTSSRETYERFRLRWSPNDSDPRRGLGFTGLGIGGYITHVVAP